MRGQHRAGPESAIKRSSHQQGSAKRLVARSRERLGAVSQESALDQAQRFGMPKFTVWKYMDVPVFYCRGLVFLLRPSQEPVFIRIRYF